jgi:hypothetical protein
VRARLTTFASLATVAILALTGFASFSAVRHLGPPHLPASLLSYEGQRVYTWTDGHPVNAGGFVLDGSPQLDDAHCVGTDLQRSECYAARRPQCSAHGRKSWDQVVACWAPEVDLYPWPATWALNVIECESGGDQWAVNPGGPYVGLMQEGGGNGTTDPALEIYRAYQDYYATEGGAPWSTSGMVCH